MVLQGRAGFSGPQRFCWGPYMWFVKPQGLYSGLPEAIMGVVVFSIGTTSGTSEVLEARY
ncbi:hypothetical protein BY996DRAFT_6441294 [Phakopsora pachyrhizi]|nr:hypothetical protein BY996DRAFT_6441294 [Phakopsora pachyrhizi]